jgi:Flp pilus assembly protein TadD
MSLGTTLGSLLSMNVVPVFEEALRLDEEGSYLQAFHLYMKTAEMGPPDLAAKAMNNAAAILGERGFPAEAADLLRAAAELAPENGDIRENLALLEPGRPRRRTGGGNSPLEDATGGWP